VRPTLDERLSPRKFSGKREYREVLDALQRDMLDLQMRLLRSKRSLVLVFEGPDAAGKGGVIRRVVEKLDPRVVRVHPVGKPTDEELARHYLWRFWTRLPRRGEMCIFDRSWYGRVLVERVEGFATEAEWRRAYAEINTFEKWLVDDGAVMMKFYLHISKAEQLRRFKARAADPLKHWKINDEDWRNRRKWKQHNLAADDMMRLTHSTRAPWHFVGSDFKWWMRVAVMKQIVRTLTRELVDH
jgi:polyphosphate kinase 2 (PPK2 family)